MPYARAKQERYAATADDDAGKSPCRLARTESESSGQRTLSRFGNGSRGSGSGLDPDGAGRLYRALLSRSGSDFGTRHDNASARPGIFRKAQYRQWRTPDAITLQ